MPGPGGDVSEFGRDCEIINVQNGDLLKFLQMQMANIRARRHGDKETKHHLRLTDADLIKFAYQVSQQTSQLKAIFLDDLNTGVVITPEAVGAITPTLSVASSIFLTYWLTSYIFLTELTDVKTEQSTNACFTK